MLTIVLAIATVMGNWHNVLRAISMASCTESPYFPLFFLLRNSSCVEDGG